MAVTYKDIDLLTQKSSVSGTEKLPVSDTQYITPSQIVSGVKAIVPKAAWFDKTDYMMYWFASPADKDAFIEDQTQTQLVLFSAYLDLHGSVESIYATYTQTAAITPFSSLDDLRNELVVKAVYQDGYEEVISDYTLSGTLSIGTSAITASYNGLTDTFSVSVTYKYALTFSEGDMQKLPYSAGYKAANGAYLNTNSVQANRRRCFVVNNGDRCLKTTSDDTTFVDNTDYYPIAIPPDATSVVISITPNTQYFGATFYTLENGEYVSKLDPGWKHGSNTFTFTAGQYGYITLTSKYNSAGTTYPTEPSELSVTFGK